MKFMNHKGENGAWPPHYSMVLGDDQDRWGGGLKILQALQVSLIGSLPN